MLNWNREFSKKIKTIEHGYCMTTKYLIDPNEFFYPKILVAGVLGWVNQKMLLGESDILLNPTKFVCSNQIFTWYKKCFSGSTNFFSGHSFGFSMCVQKMLLSSVLLCWYLFQVLTPNSVNSMRPNRFVFTIPLHSKLVWCGYRKVARAIFEFPKFCGTEMNRIRIDHM